MKSVDVKQYKSNSQIIRVKSESWVWSKIYCPSCGGDLDKFRNNKPVSDFYCKKCPEEFELKSKKDSFGNKIVDGAYHTLISKLEDRNAPNFFLLNYNKTNFSIINFCVIPKHFFVPRIIEKRKPLSSSAKRAGWVGCNILLGDIPKSGRIFYIKNEKVVSKPTVLNNWEKTLFLDKRLNVHTKGWLIDTMLCIDMLQKKKFTLREMYSFKDVLKKKHPDNKHIKDKIRQQLQLLRDKGYIEFLGNGHYKLK